MTTGKRFQGIVRTVTLSKQDMARLMEMPLEEVDAWSPVGVQLFDDWESLHQAMARAMVDKIVENNRAGRITTFICPVGPTEQYPIAAEISNRERISWRNVWTFNMDEYLDWQGRPDPGGPPDELPRRDAARSLRPAGRRSCGIPEAQRWFPDPFDPDAIDAKIDEVTGGAGVDICFGGIGEHGHVAFNEAPTLMAHYAHLTPEEFKNSSRRVLPHLNWETLARAFREPAVHLVPAGRGHAGDAADPRSARRIMLATAGVQLRIAAMHPPTHGLPRDLHPGARRPYGDGDALYLPSGLGHSRTCQESSPNSATSVRPGKCSLPSTVGSPRGSTPPIYRRPEHC